MIPYNQRKKPIPFGSISISRAAQAGGQTDGSVLGMQVMWMDVQQRRKRDGNG